MTRPIINPPAIIKPADDLQALAAEINAEHVAGDNAARRGLEHYRAAGEKLLQAKEKCNHGEWLAWVKANVKFSQEQARRYMRLAKSGVTTDLDEHWRIISGNAPKEESED